MSAFLVVVWYAYRNRGALKFSALIRTIVTEATIYFLAMVTAQTCMQLSFVRMEVRPSARFLRCFSVAKYNHHRVWGNNFCIRECTISLNDNSSQMTVSASRVKSVWNVRLPCTRSRFEQLNSPPLQHKSHIDREVCGLVEAVCRS